MEGGPKMKMDRGGMQQMMARMHGRRQVVLPSELMSIPMPSPESGLTFYAITTSVEGVPGEHDGQGQERREEDKHGFFACPRDKV